MKATVAVLLTISGILFSAKAETRIWTSRAGDSVEAELVKVISKKVVLEKMNGKQIQVPISQLCEADQKFLATMNPPRIGIEVDDDVDDKNTGSYSGYSYDYSRKRERLKCEVVVKKKSREDNAMPLTAYLFIFSKDLRMEEYIIEAALQWEFSFENQNAASFSSESITLEHTKDSYSGDSGRAYEGYLFWVETEKGQLVGIKSSGGTFEKNYMKVKPMVLKTKFDSDFTTTFVPSGKKRGRE